MDTDNKLTVAKGKRGGGWVKKKFSFQFIDFSGKLHFVFFPLIIYILAISLLLEREG